jgi:hypothetical protein
MISSSSLNKCHLGLKTWWHSLDMGNFVNICITLDAYLNVMIWHVDGKIKKKKKKV